jgi:hypothetical protein
VRVLTLLFRIGGGSLICLMPLALYFLFLATLNQRRRPTMLTGLWDFTCLLLGLSGFLLLGGPVLVAAINSALRNIMLSGTFAEFRAAWRSSGMVWSILAGAYLASLSMVIALFMLLRRKVTVIYNIDPDALPDLLTGLLDGEGLRWRRVPGGLEIVRSRGALDGDQRPPLPGDRAFVAIRSFPALRHVSLEWRHAETALLREEVESRVDKLLQTTESAANPAGGWFMSTAITIFVIMLIWMAFLIWVMVAHPKGF